jgi:hypothetical protein
MVHFQAARGDSTTLHGLFGWGLDMVGVSSCMKGSSRLDRYDCGRELCPCVCSPYGRASLGTQATGGHHLSLSTWLRYREPARLPDITRASVRPHGHHWPSPAGPRPRYTPAPPLPETARFPPETYLSLDLLARLATNAPAASTLDGLGIATAMVGRENACSGRFRGSGFL